MLKTFVSVPSYDTQFSGYLRRDVTSPEGEVVGIHKTQLVADRGNVVDQTQVVKRVILRCRGRVDVQTGKGKDSSSLPLLDILHDFGSPHEIRLIGSSSSVIRDGQIIVWASDLVLRAVTTVAQVSFWLKP